MKKQKETKKVAVVDRSKTYSIAEAAELLPQISTSKFVGTIELEVKLRLKDKQKNESIRGSYTLPHSFGKEVKVLVFADASEKSKVKGADIVGGEELIADVEAGKLDFDIVISTPTMMPKIAKLGRTLGSKGLMPNPKNGTVTADLETAVDKFKSGMRQFKMADNKINAVVGKADMTAAQIAENFNTVMSALKTEINKVGSGLIKTIKIKPTMGKTITVASE